ncbi:hypothetical protein LTR69_010068 [Exophiala sideris]|uniref:Transcription factor domain-containing protein n=1 Tax=Exophiala sideris TaxID=1016849 RepID=A0ABR0IZM1_9EURO|nr:hypothetical protein LTR69_010068 [Exophiala sideris]
MTLEDFALPNDSIEFNIAKLSMLVARFLTSLCEGGMTPSTQEVFFHAIEDWASNLPQNLRYFPATSDPQTSQANEVGSLYLETFYFASVMTLTKPEFYTSLSTGRQQNSPHSRLFSQACVDASVQIGHAATIILNRGFLCKQSWLITTLVYHAGLVLALSLSVQTTSVRYSLKPSGSHSPETQGLDANMNVLSTCAPFNAMAAHFDKVLKYFRALINSCEEAKSASMSHQMDGRELFRAPPWPPTPSSWRNSSISTTSPTSTLWQTSPDMPVMYSLPPSSSYQVLAGSDPTAPISMDNDMSRATVTNYYPQPTIVDPTYIGWPATLPNEGSSYSFVSKSSSQSGHGSIDSGFEHYKPYMQNFWATEAFNSGQQMGSQGNVNTSSQYG